MAGEPAIHFTSAPPAVPLPADDPLTRLVRRLEAATSRLEDIAASSGSIEEQANGSISGASGAGMPKSSTMPDLPKGGSREASTSTVIRSAGEKDEAGGEQSPPGEDLPERIEEMDQLIENQVREYVDSGKGIDPLVEEQASGVEKAFGHQRQFLMASTTAKKPDPSSKAFMDLLSDLQQDMGHVVDIKDSNRGSQMKEHLSMVGEGMGAFQWLIMDGKPADYVGDVVGGAQMYGNRILKTYKEGDQSHIKYVNSFVALLKALQGYVKKHYPSGVTWNNNGTDDAMQAYREADLEASPTTNGAAATPSSVGGAPPPPPPPLPNFDNAPTPPAGQKSATGGDMGAIFEQLNRGESVTAGLKKVDKSQMTHKNPTLRASGAVPDKSAASSASDIARSRSPGPEIKPKPPSMRQNSSASQHKSTPQPKKEPKKELDGNKWLVENYDSPSSPIELEVSLTQSILISKCKNTTLLLRGKANAVSIDNSPKLQVLVDSLVSSVDVIKCSGFAIQITGTLPTIMLDQVDGAQVYLGKDSLATEVFTSKCSSVNVVLPAEGEDEDSTECPLPEQIRTVVKEGKLVSEIVEHAG